METIKNTFAGQDFYVGIDGHKRQWNVTIRLQHMELKNFSMNPSAKELADHMNRIYPGGTYHSCYEAGFCGFHIHKDLTGYGFDNSVVNPADVPLSDSGFLEQAQFSKLLYDNQFGKLMSLII